MKKVHVAEWHNCYNDSWKGLIVDDAFAHPAKFAPGLIRRILQHGLDKGYWRIGDTLGDPFGGIAGGGVMAGQMGLNWLGVELEPKFVELGNRNLAANRKFFAGADVRLVQGDSRRFAEIVAAQGVVTSPPYVNCLDSGGADTQHPDGASRHMHGVKDRYGQTPGQIGRLPAGELGGIAMSPPFATEQSGNGIAKANGKGTSNVRIGTNCGYQNQAASEGNIAAPKEGDVGAVVTSPPYADSLHENETAEKQRSRMKPETLAKMGKNSASGNGGYGMSEGQIAAEVGETYWTAMKAVYAQCYLGLKPGGYMAIVVKDYCKAGKIVPLCNDTMKLLKSLRFIEAERIRTMLVKTTTREGLFETETRTKDRKSFFRRLYEKNGGPRIDWEEVLIMRRPV